MAKVRAKRIAKFDHLAMPVKDPRRSRDWYVKNLDFRIEFDRGEIIAIQDTAGFTIFLVRAKEPLTGSKVTVTIQVNDVDAKYRALARRRVKFVNPPQTLFWGYGAELRDPDGYMINLWDRVSMRRAAPSNRRAT